MKRQSTCFVCWKKREIKIMEGQERQRRQKRKNGDVWPSWENLYPPEHNWPKRERGRRCFSSSYGQRVRGPACVEVTVVELEHLVWEVRSMAVRCSVLHLTHSRTGTPHELPVEFDVDKRQRWTLVRQLAGLDLVDRHHISSHDLIPRPTPYGLVTRLCRIQWCS